MEEKESGGPFDAYPFRLTPSPFVITRRPRRTPLSLDDRAFPVACPFHRSANKHEFFIKQHFTGAFDEYTLAEGRIEKRGWADEGEKKFHRASNERFVSISRLFPFLAGRGAPAYIS